MRIVSFFFLDAKYLRDPWTWVVLVMLAGIISSLAYVIYQGKPRNLSTFKFLLRGLAWLLLGIGGLAFWFGGGLIHAINNTDRTLAEMEGIGLATICLVLGGIAKHYSEADADEDSESRSALD